MPLQAFTNWSTFSRMRFYKPYEVTAETMGHIEVCTYMYAYMCAFDFFAQLYACMCMCVCTWMYMRVCVSESMCACGYVRVRVCVCVRACVCMCGVRVCMCVYV